LFSACFFAIGVSVAWESLLSQHHNVRVFYRILAFAAMQYGNLLLGF
jgi:hypothetical protein